MNTLINTLIKLGLLKEDLDYHLLRVPNGWDPAAGFPAMAGNVPFLVKDVVLLAVSIYLLKQDVMRVALAARSAGETKPAAGVVTRASAAATNP